LKQRALAALAFVARNDRRLRRATGRDRMPARAAVAIPNGRGMIVPARRKKWDR
jgi:hypothetical protein